MWREREPAERIEFPAFFLIVSGIMQIAGSAALAILLGLAVLGNPGFEFGMSTIIALLALLLLIASMSVGAVVVAGAVKMRKLKNYRFCRMTSILSMLPLGYGFLFGLPFGVWALRVLRRPDVRAAFAVNDGF